MFNICLIFIIFCAFVECNQTLKRFKRLDDSSDQQFFTVEEESDSEDMKTVEIQCTGSLKKETNKLHIQSFCRPPRKQYVQVKMPQKFYMPGLFHKPNIYEVERCDGFCQQPNHKCLPIKREWIEVPVITGYSPTFAAKLGSLTDRTETCMRIKMEKHMLCGCQCSMTQKNCNDKQAFSEDRCRCECKDLSQAHTCSQQNKMWSMEKCECVCAPTTSQDCSSGAVFDEDSCRCLQTNG